jgi:hypothetical protein
MGIKRFIEKTILYHINLYNLWFLETNEKWRTVTACIIVTLLFNNPGPEVYAEECIVTACSLF